MTATESATPPDARAVARVGQVLFDLTSFDHAVEELLHNAEARVCHGGVRLSNAWCVVMAERDPRYRDVLNAPGRTYPDGMPVASILRRRNRSARPERVRGPSLFMEALKRSGGREVHHFFLGATPATLEAMLRNAKLESPSLSIAGSWAPPFGPVTDHLVDDAVARIHSSEANLVWVGMGSPKQDFLANELAARTGVQCVAVGAAFDFLGGTVREAPVLIQRAGLEWLFRLVSEPKRLWRRYLIGNVQFLLIALLRTDR